ncbi:MAG: site-specific integrase [Polyangiaceae bacterium]|nr:site-specific integrase [Polyangiaceae bacterium]
MFSRKRASGKSVHFATYQFQGRQLQELVGTDKREAQRIESLRKREIREGRFQPGQHTGAVSAAKYAETWGKARTNRTAKDDRQRLRDHFVGYFGTKIHLHEIGEPEALRYVRWLGEKVRGNELAARTARSVRGVVRTMFRDARLEGLIAVDPFLALPRKLLPKPPRSERRVYTREEARTLLHDERLTPSVRVLLALMLYCGVREGEACGRRWRDWDPKVEPLGSLHVSTQYLDEPLKTDSARKVPVHPDLDAILRDWWEHGFELTFCRPPTLDDFIVPATRGGNHTKSSAYKAMRHACGLVGVRFEGCHLTRHTMITWARRGGARSDVLERVTHNATGVIIDQYTHFDWAPLCEAVGCLDYGEPLAGVSLPPPALPSRFGRALAAPSAHGDTNEGEPEVHVASHVASQNTPEKSDENGWRRRESNRRHVSRPRRMPGIRSRVLIRRLPRPSA